MPQAARPIDLLAIDLDGTLLRRDGSVSRANRDAVGEARRCGVRVTVCTGRGLVECEAALAAIEQTTSVVVATGAMIACPATKRTEHRFAIEPDLAAHAVGAVLEHGHAALVLKDPLEVGYDYLVVHGRERHALDPVTEWWFGAMNVRVRRVATIDDDEHPGHTVRVGACGVHPRMAAIKERIARSAGERAVVHHFPAVVAPDHASRDERGERLHVLELFHRDANKWSAIRALAAREGMSLARVAAIGDEINDASMVGGAAIGVAMGNAVPGVAAVASHHTSTNEEDGVAHAIEQILAGRWRPRGGA